MASRSTTFIPSCMKIGELVYVLQWHNIRTKFYENRPTAKVETKKQRHAHTGSIVITYTCFMSIRRTNRVIKGKEDGRRELKSNISGGLTPFLCRNRTCTSGGHAARASGTQPCLRLHRPRRHSRRRPQ
jgi:hypothetical protein